MQFSEIETDALEILREAGGHFLFPYQIFNRIKDRNELLATRIETEYSSQMGAGAGVPYSPASFVSHALEYFMNTHQRSQIRKIWHDVTDVKIEGIEPGNLVISAWAWED